MSIMTKKEACELTLKCLAKGKKGVAAVFRSEDGILLFSAPKFRQHIVRLDIHLDDQVITEDNFSGLLVMRSNFDKAEHWVTIFELPTENPMDSELQFKKSSLVNPFEFTCSIVMENAKQQQSEDDADSKWFSYKMFLHGAEGAAMLIQDDGAARLASLEISVARREAAFISQYSEEEGASYDNA